MDSRAESILRRPLGVLLMAVKIAYRMATTAARMTALGTNKGAAMNQSLMPNTNSEMAGSSWFCSANIALNLGTMTSIRKITMPTAMNSTMEGYTMAEITLLFSFCAFSWYSARRFSTTSSTPPSSPAFTMFTNRRSKILGCWARASEKVEPPCTESPRASMVTRRLGFASCLASTFKLWSRGSPASIRVASWRVKIIRALALILPPSLPFCFLPPLAFFLAAGVC